MSRQQSGVLTAVVMMTKPFPCPGPPPLPQVPCPPVRTPQAEPVKSLSVDEPTSHFLPPCPCPCPPPPPQAAPQAEAAPILSADKRSRQEKPLDFLVQKVAVDPSTKWRRVYALGPHSEVLAVVSRAGTWGGGGGRLYVLCPRGKVLAVHGIIAFIGQPGNRVVSWHVSTPHQAVALHTGPQLLNHSTQTRPP